MIDLLGEINTFWIIWYSNDQYLVVLYRPFYTVYIFVLFVLSTVKLSTVKIFENYFLTLHSFHLLWTQSYVCLL